MSKRIYIALLLLLMATGAFANNPKREFRGAWLHVIGQTQWQDKTTAQAQAYVRDQLDRLKDAGCNAVIFQVRPTADAVYKSDLEPWSAWLTGKRGKAPDPMWDPMEYVLEEVHKRGMEFHAWLNPYRVTSTAKEVLPSSHISNREPQRFFRYNGQVLFDPAYQENRDAICEIVSDILKRYDVDGIHIDDYFYPYPAPGKKIPDGKSFAKFGNGMSLNDWRRHNVDLLIEQLHSTVKKEKPWVRFGVSPFGIWRNRKNDPRGSESSGLQNYDDLYADVLLWAKKGWIDYLAPQLYWSLDTKAAPSRSLAKWWNDNANGVDIYIGQDVKRTMDSPDPGNHDRNELDTKVRMSRELPNVAGNIWWHGYWVTGNYKGAADSLAMKYQSTLALPPVYGDKSKKPAAVTDIKIVKQNGKQYLEWKPVTNSQTRHGSASGKSRHGSDKKDGLSESYRHGSENDVVRYVVYEFFPGESQDFEDSQTIIAVTPYTRLELAPDSEGSTFAVTALDRMNRESAPLFLYSR